MPTRSQRRSNAPSPTAGPRSILTRSRPAINKSADDLSSADRKTADECVAHFAGKGYGDFKGELAEVVVEFLRPFQERVKQYNDDALKTILETGAEKARARSAATLADVYSKSRHPIIIYTR